MKALIALLFLLQCASASMIQWYSAPRAENVTEDGTPLHAGFHFEIGVFRNGFVPTADNIAEWSSHWVAAQRVGYHEGNRWFTGVVNVTDNQAPFTQGAQAWIWGFSGDPEEGEWILFRRNTWNWPRANATRPTPLIWDTAQANQILIGDIGTGAATLMRAGRVQDVVPPTTTWAQWLKDTGNSPGPASLLEYATGSAESRLTLQSDGNGFSIHTPRRTDRPANIRLQVSTDLVHWHPAPAALELFEESSTRLVFRKNQTSAVDDRILFFRSEISLKD